MDNLHELNTWIEKIKKSNILIVVEGRKDKDALERLGLENIIFLKKPLYKVAEEISLKCKKCIILTDLDKKGKQLFERLKKNLVRLGVQIDESFRNFLFKNTKLRQIEGFTRYLSNQKCNNKT